jgi:hypothetical protein
MWRQRIGRQVSIRVVYAATSSRPRKPMVANRHAFGTGGSQASQCRPRQFGGKPGAVARLMPECARNDCIDSRAIPSANARCTHNAPGETRTSPPTPLLRIKRKEYAKHFRTRDARFGIRIRLRRMTGQSNACHEALLMQSGSFAWQLFRGTQGMSIPKSA